MPLSRYEEEKVRKYNRVINEEDFMPLHFIHLLLKTAKLIRKFKNKEVITNTGKKLLLAEKTGLGKLQSTLFKSLVNDFNIAYLDGVPIEGVIQPQFGQILFLIYMHAEEWINPDTLMKLTMIPVDEMFSGFPHFPEMMFEARMIRYLVWFGLMEERDLSANDAYPRIFEVRKTALFNEFISYDGIVSTI